MTLKLTPQARLLAALGLALVVALAAAMVLRSGVLSSNDESVPASPSITQPRTDAPKTTPVKPKPAPARPKIELLPGLPQPVAHALRFSKVVVVSVHAGPAINDHDSVGVARKGAKLAGAGFVAIDVFRERSAKQLEPFSGTVNTPTLLVVSRPGKIVNRFQGVVDEQVVAQAARNAGARTPKKPKK